MWKKHVIIEELYSHFAVKIFAKEHSDEHKHVATSLKLTTFGIAM